MTAPSVKVAGAGVRSVKVFALDANNIIYSTGTSAYAGLEVTGAREVSLTDPEPRRITHVGDDRPFAITVLPATEPVSGQIRVSKQNDTLDVALQGVKSVTIDEMKLYPFGTDKRGEEAQMCVITYRTASDVDPSSSTFGKQLWQAKFLPLAWVTPLEAGFNDNAEERVYSLNPNFAKKYPWGVSFSTSTEGCTMAQGFRLISEHKPDLCAWVTDNATTAFTLPEAAYSTAKIITWSVTTAGVGTVTTATTITTAALQFTTAPTTGTLVCLFEKS